MPSKIRVLSDHTINKIAAGEVIENPASVVKELVENSIDAGAKEICIEIRGGGRQLIRISDDGCGMNSDDALLCLERHATSKLRDVDDIHTILTMGFRGEAVPSIASISKFTLLTCPKDEKNTPSEGTMVLVDGGKVLSCVPAARSPGTTIEVKALFFNVPVRKKFLKSPAYDANEILKTITLIALGHPDIAFTLISDEKKLLSTALPNDASQESALKTRIDAVLGSDFLGNSNWITSFHDTISISGVVGTPSYTRHNRSGQYLFINKRAIISPLVSYAVKEGYGTALASERHPVFVLHLTLPGDLVDVNVHPQKREVRLRQEALLRALIADAVKGALRHAATPEESFFAAPAPPISPVFARAFHTPESPLESSSTETHTPWVFRPRPEATPTLQHSVASEYLVAPSMPVQQAPPPKPAEMPTLFSIIPRQVPFLQVLATLPRYILIDGTVATDFKGSSGAGLMLIDQKAAHTRILFEKLLYAAEKGKPIQQRLLIPYQIEMSLAEAEALRSLLPTLEQMGIQLREFGARVFMVDEIPQICDTDDVEGFISDIIHDMQENLQRGTSQGQLLEQEKAKRIAMIASRRAVAPAKRLSNEEAQRLVNQLAACEQPGICPMGRPTFVSLSTDAIAKLF